MATHDIERGRYINASGTIVEVTGLALNMTSGTKQVMAKYRYKDKKTIELVQEINEFHNEYTQCGPNFSERETGHHREE